MKRNWMKDLLLVALLPALLFGGTAAFSPAKASAEGTFEAQSPSASVSPLSIFNPNHLYLDSGSSLISATTGSVTITADTSSNIKVDSIGLTVYVQKWNGSSWETVGAGNTMGGNNAAYYSNSVSKSVTSGYYYRARTIHWVIHKGVYEEGERFTSSVLVP